MFLKPAAYRKLYVIALWDIFGIIDHVVCMHGSSQT